jgi:hypothetical protein
MEDHDKSESRNATDGIQLGSAIRSFAHSLTALRDFVTLVGTLLSDREKSVLLKNRKELIPILLAVNAVMKDLVTDEQVEELKKEIDCDIKFEVTGKNQVQLKVEDAVARRALSAFKDVSVSSSHNVLLYRSALISLVSSAEWLLSQVIRQHLQLYPGALGTKDKLLSLEDLWSFGSIDEAKRHLIDMRINEIMWGGFDDWLKYCTEKIKLSAGYLIPHKDRLIEIFQRRNVMVHNNGLVHSSYINKVPPQLRPKISLGDELPVSPDYLKEAIDLVESSFILIAAELWKRLDPKDGSRGSALIDVVFERLLQERWIVAERLSYFLKEDKKIEERLQIVGLLNYWQSIKWADRLDDIKAEIQSEDFTAKDEVYQLARYALLDDMNAFMSLLPKVLKAGKLDAERLRTWPIFKEMRKTPEFFNFVKEHGSEFKLEEDIDGNKDPKQDGADVRSIESTETSAEPKAVVQ